MPKTGDETNIHAGHRERMRTRFRKTKGTGFVAHELLEMMLYYTIPVKNTNFTAHELLKGHHSLKDMFQHCQYDDFIKIKNVGEKTATMLAIIAAIFQSEETWNPEKKITLKTVAERCQFFLEKMRKGNYHEEVLMVACLSEKMEVLCFEVLENGTVGHIQVSAGKIAKFVFQSNCSRVILAHNHLNGVAKPSYEDVVETRKLFNLLASLEIELTDHIIVGGEDTYSMAEHHDF